MKRVKKHVGVFQYSNKEIVFSYWSNLDKNSAPDVVIFLGAGTVGLIPRLVGNGI